MTTLKSLSDDIKILTDEIRNLKADIVTNFLRQPNTNNSTFKQTVTDRTKYLNRDEILTLLLGLGVTEKDLILTTNYKQMLLDRLKRFDYHGCVNFIVLNEWFKENKPLKPMTDEMLKIKERTLILVEERRKLRERETPTRDITESH
jgi:hypothetical protein